MIGVWPLEAVEKLKNNRKYFEYQKKSKVNHEDVSKEDETFELIDS